MVVKGSDLIKKYKDFKYPINEIFE